MTHHAQLKDRLPNHDEFSDGLPPDNEPEATNTHKAVEPHISALGRQDIDDFMANS